MIATAAATTVMMATAPNAACSRTLMPNFAAFAPKRHSWTAQPRNEPSPIAERHCAGLLRDAKPGAYPVTDVA